MIPLVACRVEGADSIALGSSEAGAYLSAPNRRLLSRPTPPSQQLGVFLQPKVRPESPLLICYCDLRKREVWGVGGSASLLPQVLATWTVRLDSTAELKMRVTDVCTILSSRCPNSAVVPVRDKVQSGTHLRNSSLVNRQKLFGKGLVVLLSSDRLTWRPEFCPLTPENKSKQQQQQHNWFPGVPLDPLQIANTGGDVESNSLLPSELGLTTHNGS